MEDAEKTQNRTNLQFVQCFLLLDKLPHHKAV